MTIPLFTLPQPPPSYNNTENDPHAQDAPRQEHYQYVPFDIFETDWLGDPRRLPLIRSTSHAAADPAAAGDAAANYDNNSTNCNANGNENNPVNTVARYSPGTLVWVMLSKGKPKHANTSTATATATTTTTATPISGCAADALAIHKKRRNKKNKGKVTSNSYNTCFEMSESVTGRSQQEQQQHEEDELISTTTTTNTTTLTVNHHSRREFFLRARVVADDEEIMIAQDSSSNQWERRVLVRYSRGATYRVHAYNLIPVLEPSVHNVATFSEAPSKTETTTATTNISYNYPPLVVIVPETNIYRRVAKVHTTPEDTFMEIGCDYGITVDRIRQSLEEAGDVPKVWRDDIPDDNEKAGSGDNKEENQHSISCLGIDKSVESIKIANERYDAKKEC